MFLKRVFSHRIIYCTLLTTKIRTRSRFMHVPKTNQALSLIFITMYPISSVTFSSAYTDIQKQTKNRL